MNTTTNLTLEFNVYSRDEFRWCISCHSTVQVSELTLYSIIMSRCEISVCVCVNYTNM